jgi:hypothetical protein
MSTSRSTASRCAAISANTVQETADLRRLPWQAKRAALMLAGLRSIKGLRGR